MHSQGSPTPAGDEDRIDASILAFLADPDEQRPWSDDEVAREVGDRLVAGDALARLHRLGLVHRLDGFVFATRPAVQVARLAG
jgi:hypothetical protein